jgi:hypothetical protein
VIRASGTFTTPRISRVVGGSSPHAAPDDYAAQAKRAIQVVRLDGVEDVPDEVRGAFSRLAMTRKEDRDSVPPVLYKSESHFRIEERTPEGVSQHVYDKNGKPIAIGRTPWGWKSDGELMPRNLSKAAEFFWADDAAEWRREYQKKLLPASVPHGPIEPPYEPRTSSQVERALQQFLSSVPGATRENTEALGFAYTVRRGATVTLYTRKGEPVAERVELPTTWTPVN